MSRLSFMSLSSWVSELAWLHMNSPCVFLLVCDFGDSLMVLLCSLSEIILLLRSFMVLLEVYFEVDSFSDDSISSYLS